MNYDVTFEGNVYEGTWRVYSDLIEGKFATYPTLASAMTAIRCLIALDMNTYASSIQKLAVQA